jgi:hypothetical protein
MKELVTQFTSMFDGCCGFAYHISAVPPAHAYHQRSRLRLRSERARQNTISSSRTILSSIDICASPFGRQRHQLLHMLLPQCNEIFTIRLALESDLQLIVPETVEVAHAIAT